MRTQAEANLSALIESTEDLIWSVDLDFRLTVFNSALRRNIEGTFGSQVALGMRIEDLLPPERAALWPPFYQRLLSAGPFRTEYTLLGGCTVEFSFNPIVADDEITGISVFGKDITARKRALAKLSESEARFRKFIEENSSVIVLVEPVTGEILDVNDAAVRYAGMPKEQLVGKHIFPVCISPPDELKANLGRAMTGEKCVFSFRVRLGGGEPRDVEAYTSPIEGDGKARLFVIVHDVTERKLASKALAKSEARFRGIFESSRSMMMLIEPISNAIADANRAASAFYGYTHEELVGMPLDRINTLPLEQILIEREQAISQTRNHFNFRHRLASGAIRDVEVYATPIDVDGRTLLFSIIYDVTDRVLAEQTLRQNAESLAESQKIGGLGSYMLDIASGVWTSSDLLDEIFGIGEEDERTVSLWAELLHPEDQAMMAAYFADDVLGNREPFERDYRIVRRNDGATRWVRGVGKLDFDAEGCPIRMHGFIKDITERKEAELQLRDSEERYRETFEQVAVGIIHTSLDGRFLRCNARFCEIVGYPAEELTGMTFQQITAPEDLAESVDVLKEMPGGANSPTIWEKRYVRKDGAITWVRLTVSTQRDAEGRPIHYIAVVQDINARKTAEQRLEAAQQALQASEERYRLSFQMNIDSVNINRLSDGTYIEINKAFLDLMGYRREEIIGKTSVELGIWADVRNRQKMVDKVMANRVCHNFEAQFRKKNGELVWGLMSVSLIDLDGVTCALSVTRDISESKAAKQKLDAALESLRTSEERYRTVFQTSLDCITISHLDDGMLIDVNKAYLDLMSREAEEVIGRTSTALDLWVDAEARDTLADMLRQNGTFRDARVRIRRKGGEIVWVIISASLMEIEGAPCVLSIMRDISDAKAAEDKIWNLAFYDPLTRLPNRRLLMDRLRQNLAANTRSTNRSALLFIDLDNFKNLNDTLGHQTGDLLLQEVARRLATCVRETDTVARLGGDEFVVMLDSLNEAPEEAATQAEAVAHKILETVDRPYSLNGRECFSTSSIGITVFGSKDDNTNDVLQQADIAMYQAKAAGRNTMRFFAPALQAAMHARAAMEGDLRHAIKAKQFVLFYQPQYSSTGLVGAEALVRWNHPHRGILAPLEFIPLAEETGLILPLGKWILEAACMQSVEWAKYNPTTPLCIAVNISARQFRQSGFVDQVLSVIKRTGAQPQSLDLELTESMLLENIEEVITKMNELKSHGLRFSLDDFGTGYSSLSYLKRLPLDQLKIDRSFVRDILEDVGSSAIAKSVISLGQAMGLNVITEGVETEQQREFLSGLGCNSFQGYLFSRPVPAADFQQLWLDSAKPAEPALR